jgi:hypothetical protein
MDWTIAGRKRRISYRQFVATELLQHLTDAEKDAINSLPQNEKAKFLTRLQKALEGDLSFPFPQIRVTQLPRAWHE